MNHITERCIWITGASSGIGKALVTQLAQMGNFVIASARSQNALSELSLKNPGKIKIFPLDVSNELDIKAASEKLREITDYVDIVICAAGICEYEDNLDFDPAMYQRTIDVNFLGVVRMLHLALPLLKKSQHRSQFVTISSLSTCVGFPRAEAYGASKAALNYFMQSVRADMSKLPIDFTLVRPGFIATDLVKNNDFPMPFLMSPEQASQVIIKGISARKFNVDFPLRLSIPLRLWGYFFNPWCKWIAPKITRLHNW